MSHLASVFRTIFVLFWNLTLNRGVCLRWIQNITETVEFYFFNMFNITNLGILEHIVVFELEADLFNAIIYTCVKLRFVYWNVAIKTGLLLVFFSGEYNASCFVQYTKSSDFASRARENCAGNVTHFRVFFMVLNKLSKIKWNSTAKCQRQHDAKWRSSVVGWIKGFFYGNRTIKKRHKSSCQNGPPLWRANHNQAKQA